MPSSLIHLDIIPDTEVIDTFNSYDNSTIPNEVFHLKGTVEINLDRPVEVKELYVQFRGTVESVISIGDFYYNTECGSKTYGDEIPVCKWNTVDSSEISLIESISRKAAGQANSILPIVDERYPVISKQTILPNGKSSFPFTIMINNAHQLPPSILLPHHIVKYTLSAKIKLNSITEWLKVKYWNARMNTLNRLTGSNRNSSNNNDEYHNISSSRSMESEAYSSALLTPPLSPTTTIDTTDSENAMEDSITTPPPHYNNTDLISAKLSRNNVNKKRQLLSVHKTIQICRHSHPSMTSLNIIPRVRFRGARKDRLKYEVGMAKFTCLQKKYFTFKCIFDSLCPETKIATLDYYLEQTETYPIRAGDYNMKIIPDEMVPRYRKFSREKHDMQGYENATELKLSLSLDLPQISPKIETSTLSITHKLKLIVTFVDDKKERKMALSFPMTVGTVPRVASSSINQDEGSIGFDSVHTRQELDQWFSTSDSIQRSSDNLPSYLDVLQEGNPPSPFLDT